MALNRDPITQEAKEKIQLIIENDFNDIKKISNTRMVSGWEDHLSREKLESLINYEVPKNETRNFSRLGLDRTKDEVLKVIQDLFPDLLVECSGYFLYPPTGFMGWHTNHDNPTDRIYISYATKDKQSFFRYYENGEIITDYDDAGITARRFTVADRPPYFWHCVGSQCDRISIGFTLKKVIIQEKRPMAKYALIKSGKVDQLVEWNGDVNVWSPPDGTTAVFADDTVFIGQEYKNDAFVAPTPTSLSVDQQWVNLRSIRDQLLVESDWVTLRSKDQGIDTPTAWKEYRQALRDFPADNPDPDEEKLDWPKKPSS